MTGRAHCQRQVAFFFFRKIDRRIFFITWFIQKNERKFFDAIFFGHTVRYFFSFFLSPSVLMHGRLICIAFCLSVKNNYQKLIHTQVYEICQNMDENALKVALEGRGHRSRSPGQKHDLTVFKAIYSWLLLTWVKAKGHWDQGERSRGSRST